MSLTNFAKKFQYVWRVAKYTSTCEWLIWYYQFLCLQFSVDILEGLSIFYFVFVVQGFYLSVESFNCQLIVKN